jgi:hypothetical protein
MSIKPEDMDRQFLYKYRPLIGTSYSEINQNTLKILKYGELYFAKPSQFNDPFDSKITYDTNANELELRAYFSRILPQFGKSLSDVDIILEKIKRKEINLSDFAPANSYADLSNILCLSRDEKNILLWSHYAKDHTGICIGLNVHIWGNSMNIKIKPGYTNPIAGINNNLLPAVYINYSNDKPEAYNHFTDGPEKLEPYFYTKSKLWEYEKEVRIILMNSLITKNPVCIEQIEIGEIIFGLKTPDLLIEKVKDIVRTYPDNGVHTKLYKCIEMKESYAINKEPL